MLKIITVFKSLMLNSMKTVCSMNDIQECPRLYREIEQYILGYDRICNNWDVDIYPYKNIPVEQITI